MSKDKTRIKEFVEPIAVSVPDASELIGISERSMYDLVRVDGFPSLKIGGRIMVSVEGLREWVRKRAELSETAVDSQDSA